MKTAGLSSVLSCGCAVLAFACSSQVSIGRNDKAVGSNGAGGETDDGSASVSMAGAVTSMAGRATDSGGHVQVGPLPGSGGQGNPPGATHEADPAVPQPLPPGTGNCVPVDATGSLTRTLGVDLLPGTEAYTCGATSPGQAADIYAVHSVNSIGIVDTVVGFSSTPPPSSSGPGCITAGPETLVQTHRASEQLTMFDAPIHVAAGDFISAGLHAQNVTDQPMSTEAAIFLLTSPAATIAPCMLHDASVQLNGGWELNPGDESITCTRITLAYDHDVTLARVANAPEVIESVLTFGVPTGPDGTTFCDVSADATTLLAKAKGASTVEAKPRDVHMLAGQQVVLRVDAANVTNRWITGTVEARLY